MTIGSGPNNRPVKDGRNFCRVHAYASLRDEVAHEGHLRLIKLTFLDFSIQLVFPQDLEDASDVLDMLE